MDMVVHKGRAYKLPSPVESSEASNAADSEKEDVSGMEEESADERNDTGSSDDGGHARGSRSSDAITENYGSPGKKRKTTSGSGNTQGGAAKKVGRPRTKAAKTSEFQKFSFFEDRTGGDRMLMPGGQPKVDLPPATPLFREMPEGGYEGTQMKLSVTISLRKRDVDADDLLDRMQKFFDIRCIQAIGSTERGFNEQHLHFQACIIGIFKSARTANDEIKKALGWTGQNTPQGTNVLCRSLTGKGLHTWLGEQTLAPHLRNLVAVGHKLFEVPRRAQALWDAVLTGVQPRCCRHRDGGLLCEGPGEATLPRHPIECFTR